MAGNLRLWAQQKAFNPTDEAKKTIEVAKLLNLKTGENEDFFITLFANLEQEDRNQFLNLQKKNKFQGIDCGL